MASWNLSMVASCPCLMALMGALVADVTVIMVQDVTVNPEEDVDVDANEYLVQVVDANVHQAQVAFVSKKQLNLLNHNLNY